MLLLLLCGSCKKVMFLRYNAPVKNNQISQKVTYRFRKIIATNLIDSVSNLRELFLDVYCLLNILI